VTDRVLRAVGLALVLAGGVALGWQVFGPTVRPNPAAGVALAAADGGGGGGGWMSPVMTGIAVVTGLILVASTGRRD